MSDIMTKHSSVLKLKKLGEDGTIEGYASTFGGEPDSYGDVIAAGAFAGSLEEHATKKTAPKMLWQHDMRQPIGKWTELIEDDKGLFAKGRLNLEVQQAREAYALLKEGDIDGLSIGYRVKNYSVDEETHVWTLNEIDLREVSIVSIGANENATVTSVKALKQHHDLENRLKAGEQLSEREFEIYLKGLGFSNSQAERAVRLHLKGQGEPDEAADARKFLEMLTSA